MIEDALWTDIFKMDIVEFTVPILVVLAFFNKYIIQIILELRVYYNQCNGLFNLIN